MNPRSRSAVSIVVRPFEFAQARAPSRTIWCHPARAAQADSVAARPILPKTPANRASGCPERPERAIPTRSYRVGITVTCPYRLRTVAATLIVRKVAARGQGEASLGKVAWSKTAGGICGELSGGPKRVRFAE